MIDKAGNLCCGCSACASICPKNCITMKANAEGFLYPAVDTDACVACGRCEKVCPVLQDGNAPGPDFREAYAAITNDSDTLLSSSSGGAFTELSKTVLRSGGCVFGAAFSEDFKSVRHIMAESEAELYALRGSKYVQSEIGETYQEAKRQLDSGRNVLFSGTPCQISGLKNYLQKDYDNLLLVDVICHGTPSPAMWEKYLSHLEQSMGGKAKYVSFRHKENDWRRFGMELPFEGDKRYYKPLGEDPYLKMFLKNDCLRESCYACKVKEAGSTADITIGDFWGVEHAEPEMDNSMGVSLVLIHTEKGRRAFEQIPSGMTTGRTDYDRAISYNSAMTQSVARPMERDCFFEDMRQLGWDKLEKKYASEKLKTKVRRMLSQSLAGKIRRKLLQRKNGGGGVENTFSYGVIAIF